MILQIDLTPEEVAALLQVAADGLEARWRFDAESDLAAAAIAKISAAPGVKLPKPQSVKSRKLFDTLNGRRK